MALPTFEGQIAAVAVLHIGGMDAVSEGPPIDVDRDVTLVAGDLLTAVIALGAAFARRCGPIGSRA